MKDVDYAGIVNLIWQRKLEFPQVLNYANQLEAARLTGDRKSVV